MYKVKRKIGKEGAFKTKIMRQSDIENGIERTTDGIPDVTATKIIK